MIEPSNNSDSVAITQQIFRVKFDKPIDSSSILSSVPVNDTSFPGQGGIYVVRRDMFDTLAGELATQKRAALSGSITIYDDSTLQLTIDAGQLAYNEDYAILVSGLNVVDVSGTPIDTIVVTDTVFHVTTVKGVHHVLGFSISNKSYVRCGDTISVSWNRKLPGTSTGAGLLAEIKKYVSSSTIDSATIEWTMAEVTSSLSLNSDSTLLYIVPADLSADTTYQLTIFPSRLNGDTNEIVHSDFQLLSHGRLDFTARSLDSAYSIPTDIAHLIGATCPRTIEVGDTTVIKAPAEFNEFYFDHWECVGDPLLHMSVSPYITKVYDCSDVNNVVLTAVYGRRTKDTVVISVDSSSYGGVAVYGFADSLGGGEYTVYRGSDKALLICATASTGRFKKWNAPGLSFHASTSTIVTFNPGSNYRVIGEKKYIGGDFGVIDCLAPPYSIDVFAYGKVYNHPPRREPQWPADIAVITPALVQWVIPDYQEGVQLRSPVAFTQHVSVDITNDCYAIQCVKVDGKVVAGTENGEPLGDYWAADITAAPPPGICYRSVDIFFIHKTFELRSEIASIDQSVVDPQVQSINRSPVGYEIQGWTKVSDSEWYRIDEYQCNESVTCKSITTAANNVGKYIEEIGWSVASPYTSQVLNVNTDELTFTMDKDRSIRYEWKTSAFLATEIGFYSYNPSDLTSGVSWMWFPIDEEGIVHDISEQIKLENIYSEFQTSAPNATIFV